VFHTPKKPYKNAKTKSVKMMTMLHSSQGNILLRKVLENHKEIQLNCTISLPWLGEPSNVDELGQNDLR